jgi:hypothetical protein
MTYLYVEINKIVKVWVFWSLELCLSQKFMNMYGHLKLWHRFLTTNFCKNCIFFLFFFVFFLLLPKSSNVSFCDKFCNRSSVETINYLVYEFHDRKTTHFEEMKIFWIWKQKAFQIKKKLISWNMQEKNTNRDFFKKPSFFGLKNIFFSIQNIHTSSKWVLQP